MPKGQRIKPEQIVMLLRQVEVLPANGKTLAQASSASVRGLGAPCFNVSYALAILA
jgi:hypothetical protein